MRKIISDIFGDTTILETENSIDKIEYESLKHMIYDYPVDTFSILNKLLNKKGICLKIEVIK